MMIFLRKLFEFNEDVRRMWKRYHPVVSSYTAISSCHQHVCMVYYYYTPETYMTNWNIPMFPIGNTSSNCLENVQPVNRSITFRGFFMVQKTPRAGAASHQNLGTAHGKWMNIIMSGENCFLITFCTIQFYRIKDIQIFTKKNLSGIRSKDWPLKTQKNFEIQETVGHNVKIGFGWLCIDGMYGISMGYPRNYMELTYPTSRKSWKCSSSIYIWPGICEFPGGYPKIGANIPSTIDPIIFKPLSWKREG